MITAGYGYGSPNLVAAVLVAIGLALAFVAVRVERAGSARPGAPAPPVPAGGVDGARERIPA